MTTPVRVFLLDDHEIVRRGLRDLLDAEEDLEVCGEAGTAEEALRRIPPTRPDVAVLDVRLPDGNGVEVCREIRGGGEILRPPMRTKAQIADGAAGDHRNARGPCRRMARRPRGQR